VWLVVWCAVACIADSKKFSKKKVTFFPKDAKVSKLSDSHYPTKESKNNWLCLFYEPQEASSKKARSEWIRLAGLLSGTGTRVGAVDCTKSSKLCEAQGRPPYPSVNSIAPSGTSKTYEGGELEAIKLMDFARQTLGRDALLSDPSRAQLDKKKKEKKKSKKGNAGAKSTGSRPDGGTLTRYTPVEVKVGVGNEGEKANMQVFIPNKGESQISDPSTLMQHVKGAWDTVVEENQAGLVDTKHQGGAIAGLSAQEAWHHYKAGKDGVIDSARFLIAFSVVPSVQSGGTPLHIAAAMGNVEQVRQLLDDGADVDAEKTDGNTALHGAAALGHAAVVDLLIEAEANIEAVGQSGATSLMVAASMGHDKVVRTLLKHGASIDAAHSFAGTTALHFAAEMGRVDVIELLCEKGADVEAPKSTGGTALHTAADTNQSKAVRTLLRPPCSADLKKRIAGDTEPLYLAAQRGFGEVCRELLLAGADVDFVMPVGSFSGHVTVKGGGEGAPGQYYTQKNTEVGNGATALHAAVENGRIQTVGVLLDFGATQSGSMQGASPLLIAIQYKHPGIALLLLQQKEDEGGGRIYGQDGGKRARVDLQAPQDGSTPLFAAAGEGYTEVVDAILLSGAKIDPTNKHGATPLSHAVVRGRTAVVQHLLKAGGDVNAKLSDGTTCLHAALSSSISASSKRTIVALLLDNGASLDTGSEGDGGGVSALMMLASGPADDAPMAQLLLKHESVRKSVDLQAPAARGGRSALMMAAERGHVGLMELLLKKPARASTELLAPRTGATALMLAAMRGQAGAVQVLASFGANVNARGDSEAMYEATALYLAAQGKRADVAKVLLKYGAEVDPVLRQIEVAPLFMAAERGDEAMIKVLLEGGADRQRTNWNRMTPFFMASVRGNLGCMRALLPPLGKDESGPAWAMITGTQKDGSDPLLCACGGCAAEEVQEGQPQPPHPSGPSERRIFEPVVSYLLEKLGQLAATNATVAANSLEVMGRGNEAGLTPLIAAAELGWSKVVKMVLLKMKEIGKTVDTQHGGEASVTARKDGRSSFTEWLDRRRESDKSTALLVASANGHIDVVRQLLRAGADYSLEDADGERAMEKARRSRDFDLINVIGRYDEAEADAAPASTGAGADFATADAADGECEADEDMIDLDKEDANGDAEEQEGGAEEQDGPHTVLGISASASVKEVKDAYRALSKQNHPDKIAQQGTSSAIQEATARFEAISTAYQQLLSRAAGDGSSNE
jgi:ankyrin repeat protein